ncbi:MAG: metallophosphoesterase [Deltaproteobacteria bacterium]|nr:metallophosphoesterase [Deltaproteobacteria bacterium]
MRKVSWLAVCSLLVACSGEASSDEPQVASERDSGASSGDDTGRAGDDTGSIGDDTGGSADDSGSSGDDTGATGDGSTTTADDGPGTSDDAAAGNVVRFVAIGDTGKGNDGQKQVADAIAAKCAKDGCDFVQLLGDNIYDSGVSSTSDPQWTTKFETPYGGISLPFFAVLGNHDYGGNGAGTEFGKGQHQVDYTKVSTKWKMPAKHYTRAVKHVDFFGLDTNMMMFSMAGEQKTVVTGWIGGAKGAWKIAFGHHPYYSNGPHGNAGDYEGLSWVPVTSGKGVKDFFDSTICGKVDVYISGHDHSRQWIKPQCGGKTELIVSGGGAAVTELKGSNPNYWQESSLGFLYVVIDGNKFTGEMIDATGKVQFTRSFTR